ncbi:extracellular solute-binding protein [Amphibacillus sp. MSJ-3]|uniref:ABC transporter substrate-binding protein n=1 Tax=Amphibacillus sp. MSJ-3 TaxID=2841505 RepID=UPI001C0F0E85|nr:extracellular solute-binding protein [Amphibacillus sp. MSJ-3]MBU5595529.1 extracellular solute-binding protein [Amphibacillus sp. MSJ-3]
MTRKAMIRLAAIILITFLFVVGCDSKDNDTTTDTEPGTDNVDNTGDEGEEPEGLPPMTDEEITLTFANWLPEEIYQSVADAFMEEYPNITVELISPGDGDYNEFLLNLAGSEGLPDAFWVLGGVDIAIRNRWLGDMTEYWENDPETENVLDTLKDIGYLDGERMLYAPSGHFPYAVLLNEQIFKDQNIDLPSPDWTYNEMIDLIEELTIPEEQIYGLYQGTNLVTMGTIVLGDTIGEYGWNGETFDLTEHWADVAQQRGDFIRNGNHAPWPGTDEAEAAFGDRDAWAPETGQVAIYLDYVVGVQRFAKEEMKELGLSYVPYPVPRGDNAETENKPAYVDFGTISPATEHPREAYELLKWMGWGVEGTKVKLETALAIDEPEVTAPLTNDEDLWELYRSLFPEGQHYDDYLERVKYPIPLGGAILPGFGVFMDEAYINGEYGRVEDAIAEGELNAHDIAQDLTNRANKAYQDAMEEIAQQ